MGSLAQEILEGARLARRAARFAAREPASALLALRMGAWVAAISLSVKVLPLPRVMRLATPLRRRRRRAADAEEVQARTARLLDALLAADVWCFTPTCWKRAPVLYRFLALEGIETRVLFGVRRTGEGALDGHAWIESGGGPVLEKTPPDFSVTFSYPA
jgi:hypothetical protein